jgi:hypothetical protein
MERPSAQALHHPQITAAVHAETCRLWVGQILAGGRSHGDGLGAGLGHSNLSLLTQRAVTRALGAGNAEDSSPLRLSDFKPARPMKYQGPSRPTL